MTDMEYTAPEPVWPWLWMFIPSVLIDMVFRILSWRADKVREPDFGWRME